MRETTRLTLVSRRYCHLCQEMELALSALLADFPIDLEVLDVDADPLLDRIGHFLLGLADMLRLVVEKLIVFGNALIERAAPASAGGEA